MTENKDKHGDKEKDKDKINEQHDKQEHVKDKEQHDSQHLEVPGTRGGGYTGPPAQGGAGGGDEAFYKTTCVSFQSEILLLEVDADTDADVVRNSHKDETFGTQRVYKKTSPNCVLTLYLPTREITLAGQTSSILRGIVFVDPKAIQGYRVYAQLTLTFRYGREDEEVMGLRFCNEAIMSLHQVWPRSEEPARESLSPLQDALLKRLGDGAHPFTLTLTPQAPPSVQLVPAKRYYGAPIGTSYDVRCFIADKTDEKFHRRASVKMGVRVIYRTDVFHQHANGPENFAALINASNNSQTASPPMTAALTSPPAPSANAAGNPLFTCTSNSAGQLTTASSSTSSNQNSQQSLQDSTTAAAPTCCDAQLPTPHSPTVVGTTTTTTTATYPTCTSMTAATNPPPLPPPTATCIKPRKSERGDSFPKLRLSPKSFRFSGRFGRSKSEIEKCPNDPFYHYSKSFQEYDSISGGGPQGAVDKPFLLQDGRVGLRASLDKAWYTHGEDVCVTVNIRNDSRKTVRKVRVCAIQHVDVCMFNNGKFKNVVADSDTYSPVDRTVPPGGSLNATIVLKPQRGPTKNWIALEDTLQRSTEPEEITGYIAASAIRSPLLLPAASGGHTPNPSPNAIACCLQQQQHQQQQQQLHQQQCQHGHYHHYYQQHGIGGLGGGGEDRNVFAIYVSYYVKVKLTLSGMGGELSLKLPFILVHVDEVLRRQRELLSLGSEELQKLALTDVPAAAKKNGHKNLKRIGGGTGNGGAAAVEDALNESHLDTIESIEDEVNIKIPIPITEATENHNNNGNGNGNGSKRKLKRSETIAKDFEDADVINEEEENHVQTATTAINQQHSQLRSSIEMENVHIVQIHAAEVATTTTTASEETTTDDVQAEIIQPDAVPHEPDVLHKEEQHSQQSSISVEIHATNANDTGAGDGDGDGV